MKPLGPGDVRRIARLARLDVGEEEAVSLARDFTAILGYLERLAAVDTDGVEPLAHPLPVRDVLRADVPRGDGAPGVARDEVLAGAPDAAPDGSLRVPRILDPDAGSPPDTP